MSDDLVKRLRDTNGGWASDEAIRYQGMTLRDAAALAALQALLATGKLPSPVAARQDETVAQFFAREAFNHADAFIAAREEKTNE